MCVVCGGAMLHCQCSCCIQCKDPHVDASSGWQTHGRRFARVELHPPLHPSPETPTRRVTNVTPPHAFAAAPGRCDRPSSSLACGCMAQKPACRDVFRVANSCSYRLRRRPPSTVHISGVALGRRRNGHRTPLGGLHCPSTSSACWTDTLCHPGWPYDRPTGCSLADCSRRGGADRTYAQFGGARTPRN